MSPRSSLLHSVLAAGLVLAATPALAAGQVATDADGRVFGDATNDPRPEWKPAPSPVPPAAMPRTALPPMPAAAPMAQPGYDRAALDQAKADWLYECRSRFADRKGRTTGTIVGGLIGGVAGSAIAGRGDRVVGAIAGGTLGAVAGSAIGNASDKRRARDYCESYLEDYLARQQTGYGYAQPGYGYGYAQGYVMQPVMMMVPVAMATVAAPAAPVQQQDCKETTVIEEWVPVTTRKRYIAPRRHVVPDKRVRIVPDKRVRAN